MTLHPTAPAEMPSRYQASEHEDRIRARWDMADVFRADPGRVLRGEAVPYSILIPPPNVTAALHLGHALNNSLQDVLIRAHRMMGYEALWMPGTDHAGIATQTVVDRRLREAGEPALAEHKAMEARGEPGRERFIAKVQAWKDEYERRITDQLKALGCSCDWSRQRFTMDEVCARAVREAFFRLFRDGLIYRGKRLVNWDPVTQTALADDEVEMREIDGYFYYLRYPLVHRREGEDAMPVTWSELAARGYPGATELPEDEQAWVTVATTRPETYLGDTAVAVNPDDPRAPALRGLHVELPLVGRVIPIIEDSYVVMPAADPEAEGVDPKARYATGFLKVTPAHDPNDYEIGQRHGLAIINVMAPDGSISANHGWSDFDPHAGAGVFVGKSREDARKLVVQEFRDRAVSGGSASLLERITPYRHSVGHSYRSHAPIEPYYTDQWYVRVTDDRLRGEAQRALAREQRTEGSLETWPESAPTTTTSRDRREAVPGATVGGHNGADLRAYLITFTTHGTWLHGDERGSVDREHNIRRTPHLRADTERGHRERASLRHEPVTLDEDARRAVAAAIVEVCDHRGWRLHACNVRTTHVHVVVEADRPPERVMNDFKSYATRKLRESGRSDGPPQRAATVRERTWTRHGSARYINTEASFRAAVRYVLDEQGEDLGGRVGRTPNPLPDGRGSSRTPSTAADCPASSDASMTFHPARYAKTYEVWHDNLRDWCISRQLWWGHRIPVWSGAVPIGAEDWPWRDVAVREFGGGSDSRACFVCVPPDRPEIEAELDRRGFRQDPDVLDTWFSSGLWPLSTLGWPDGEAAARDTGIADFPDMLAVFNPTTALLTAREIITLWVSRMVMFNRHFLAGEAAEAQRDAEGTCRSEDMTRHIGPPSGPPPFRDAFIHAMIQDGEGRKMSKSLGNGVDPLDIIHSHGADALRFTLVHMTTQTQDVRMPVERDAATGRNTSPRFDIGRNFCNKLWNASRFVITMLREHADQGDADLRAVRREDLTLPDRWMLSRIARAIDSCDEALARYQFSAYAETVYTLLWRDYCDWYLEAVKPTLKGAPAQQAVLRHALDAILRLLHPICPFITEAIFEQLRAIELPRIEDLVLEPSRKGDMLCTAGWPWLADQFVDDEAEASWSRAQDLITAIREVRAQHKVAPRRSVTLHVPTAARGAVEPIIASAEAVILALAGLARVTDAPASGPHVAFRVGESELVLSDLADALDAAAERERLEREIGEREKSVAALTGRLSNPGYANKAPAHLVQQTRDQLAGAEAELAALRAQLGALR